MNYERDDEQEWTRVSLVLDYASRDIKRERKKRREKNELERTMSFLFFETYN